MIGSESKDSDPHLRTKVAPSNSILKLVSLCLLVMLAGCDRAPEMAPGVQEGPAVQEVQEVQQTQEVSEFPAPEVEPGISLDAIAPLTPLPWLTGPPPDPGTPELVSFNTDAGQFILAVYPEAAPNAAERFLHLVDIGYYNNIPISRVVPGFVAQFGINWRQDFRDWRDDHFDDDPTLFAFEPGTMAFAKAGPNTNATQVFINFSNNNRLAEPQNFSVFAQVVRGMEVVENFKSVGDYTGGLNQTLLWDGGQAYLDYLDEKPNMILEARRIR